MQSVDICIIPQHVITWDSTDSSSASSYKWYHKRVKTWRSIPHTSRGHFLTLLNPSLTEFLKYSSKGLHIQYAWYLKSKAVGCHYALLLPLFCFLFLLFFLFFSLFFLLFPPPSLSHTYTHTIEYTIYTIYTLHIFQHKLYILTFLIVCTILFNIVLYVCKHCFLKN